MTECCVRVCTSSQGGLLDNPGLVTAGCANVLDKWDQVMSGEQTKVWQWGNWVAAEWSLYGQSESDHSALYQLKLTLTQVWREKEVGLEAEYREDGTDGAVYGDLLPNHRPQELGSEGEQSHDHQAFYDTIEVIDWRRHYLLRLVTMGPLLYHQESH